ncbi:MAG: hypothetical protein ACFFD2_30900 [Promethearchaeota archaeon]
MGIQESDVTEDKKIDDEEIKFVSEKRPISQQVALISILSAIGIAGSWAMVGLPNIEIITLTVFISGYVFGWKVGLIVGGITEAIFSGFNPMGMAVLPVFISQILSIMLVGFIGGLLGSRSESTEINAWNIYQIVVIGASLTFFFDIFTTFTHALVFTEMGGFIATFIFGIPFTIIHVASNSILFGTVPLPTTNKLRQFQFM